MSYKRAFAIDVNDPNDTLPDLIRKRDAIRVVYNKFADSEQARGGDSLLWNNLMRINIRISELKAEEQQKLKYIRIKH